MTKEFSYKKIALFFLFLQFLVVIRNIYSDYMYFFWLCDFAPIIYLFGFLFKKTQIVKGIINIAFIPQIIFLADFSAKTILFTLGNPVFDYTYSYIAITIIFHLASIIALVLTYKLPITKESLYYSFLFLLIIFAITMQFTLPQENINYVFTIHNLGYFNLNFLWIFVAFIILVIPTYYIQKKIYDYFKTKENHEKD